MKFPNLQWMLTLVISFIISESLCAQNKEDFSLENTRRLVGALDVTYTGPKLNFAAVYPTDGLLINSDIRSPQNITSLNYGLKEIMLLQPVSYSWVNNPNQDLQLGLIAQDVRKIIPEIVKGDESIEILGINYTEIIPILINALKEQQQELKQLSESLGESERKILKLKKGLILNNE